MMIRAVVLTLLLGAALGWLASEQNRGRVREAEEWFLDFLVANARDSLMAHASGKTGDVVLVEIREEEKAEYSAWPPAPLDYIMILKRLAEHEPEVLAVVEPLRWEKAETEFVTQLRNALVPFPSVILGIHLAGDSSKPTPEQTQFAANEMPVLPFAENKDGAIPKFTHVAKISDWALRIASQAGFSAIDGAGAPPTGSMPFVADEGTRLVPSLAVQAVTLFRHTPYAAQRLRFGTGARLSLGETFVIPLQADGSLVVGESPEVPTVNALELMTPDLGDEPARAVQATLGKGKVVVLGNGPRAMLHARAIATALSMPEIHRAPASLAWGLAAIACLFCFWQLRYRRFKAVILGLIAAIIVLGVNLITFQTALTWCSPILALLAVATGTLFCFLWPRGHRPPAAPSPPDPPEAQA